MKQYWLRFENWLQVNAPHLLQQLNPPASQEEIDRLQEIVGRKLPLDFLEFYKIHNGQEEQREGLIDSEQLMSIDGIIDQWKTWQELLDEKIFEDENGPYTSDPDEGVKNYWWNPFWVPITYDGNGNHMCLDLDPAPTGNIGQVIQMWHDSAYRDLYAKSFTEWFANYVTGLETGKYVYAKDWGLVDKDSPFNNP